MEFDQEDVAGLIARVEIHAILMKFLSGMDRQQWESVCACFHPGATYDQGNWKGAIEQFVERQKKVYEQFSANMHFAGNELIQIDRSHAHSELYSICLHRLKATDEKPETDSINGMRFLDEFERRNGEWRLVKRVVVIDWQRLDAVTAFGSFMTPPPKT